MNRWRPAAFALTLAALFLLAGTGCLFAANREATQPVKPQPAALKPSPDEQAAHDLLERMRRDLAVKEQQNAHLADQHFKAGKAHFDMKDWERARRHFEKALALKPDHAKAADYLRKARGFLGMEQGGAGRMLADLAQQRSVAIELRKTELRNVFEEGKRLYQEGRYREAIEAFSRAKAKAQALAPHVDAGTIAEEAEVYQQKAREAIERRRQADEKRRMQEAIEQSRLLRDKRRRLPDARTSAQLEQARALFAQRRFDQARALCDAVLRHDPASGPAIGLRNRADDAQWEAATSHMLAERGKELDRHWALTGSWTTPQSQLVAMPPELFETVRNRQADVVFLGERKEPDEWERRIREKLATEKISFDFVETPLADVLGFISSLTDVTIVLDQDSVRADPPSVTLRVNDMTLERAMNWICKLAGLKYALKNEAIFVARPDKLGDEVALRMYDVSDLTMEIKNFAGRQQALATSGGQGQNQGGQDLKDFFPPEDEDGDDEKLTGESLIEFIRRMIAPPTWEDGEERRGVIGDPFAFRGDGGRNALTGKELVDVIGLTVGGHTWAAVRTRE